MDAMNVAKTIIAVNEAIGKERIRLEPLGLDWARAESAYDEVLALAIVKLKNGVDFDMGEGQIVQNPAVTVMEKIAKGICCDEKLTMLTAEYKYKAVASNLKAMQNQLTGFQSVNKYLDSI